MTVSIPTISIMILSTQTISIPTISIFSLSLIKLINTQYNNIWYIEKELNDNQGKDSQQIGTQLNYTGHVDPYYRYIQHRDNQHVI